MYRNRRSAGCLLVLLLAGCGTARQDHSLAGAEALGRRTSELELKFPADAAIPIVQFWERNTLVVDLRYVSGAGEVDLVRREGKPWPARIALRTRPGQFGALEARGEVRQVLPVAVSGAEPVTAELSPEVHGRATAKITIRWGVRGSF